MGKLKQLHIDCTPNECLAVGYEDTCYMLSRIDEADEDTPPDPPEDFSGGDFDPQFDIDRE